MTLCDLAEKYGTDKWPGWAGGTGHSYTPFYDDLFTHRRFAPRRVLEIGISGNANMVAPSLRMWSEYFPTAQIYGIDNCPWTITNEDRIHSTFMDQGSVDDWKIFTTWCPEFDLIIDDGSHEPAHQILTARMLWPKLAAGGFYVIEDVREREAERVRNALPVPSQLFEFDLERKPDDTLLLMEKGI